MRASAGLVLLLLLTSAALLGADRASAHETPIAVLELKERMPGEFTARWIFTGVVSDQAPPTASYPEHCQLAPPILDCGARGLVGTLTVNELGKTFSGAVIRIGRIDAPTQSFTLTGSKRSVTFVTNPGTGLGAKLGIAAAYVEIGIEHILLGIDHLLFVLGLIWIVQTRWMLVKTITSFTIAHSFTLAAATFGVVGVPERPVNALIALSIVFIGVEVLKLRQGRIGLTARHPWIVAFAFGLLHGFGFATALTALGLPAGDLPLALLAFNVGVELGQIAFVFLALALIWSLRELEVRWWRWNEPIPAYSIGGIGAFWFIERIAVMLRI